MINTKTMPGHHAENQRLESPVVNGASTLHFSSQGSGIIMGEGTGRL